MTCLTMKRPWCGELVHVLGVLDASQDQVANVEGLFPHVTVMVAT
jgi:hypothetical protein